jgi:hypothetical protein
MPIQVFDAELRQSIDYVSTQEVTAMCQMSQTEIMELIDYGVLRSEMELGEVLFFSMPQVHRLQNASQHRRDYDLDLFSVVLVMGYLQEIAELTQQVIDLQVALAQNTHSLGPAGPLSGVVDLCSPVPYTGAPLAG